MARREVGWAAEDGSGPAIGSPGSPGGGAVLARWLYAFVLGAIAMALLFGGFRLVALGGSLYYLLAGCALACSAGLIAAGRRMGLTLYWLLSIATAAWAVAEVGLDGWALLPRIGAWIGLGMGMTVPLFRRSLKGGTLAKRAWLLLFAAALLAGYAVHAVLPMPVDPRFQAGTAPFPDVRASGAVSQGGEWRSWGHDEAGTRYSPLTQITPANVGDLKPVWSASIATGPAGDTGGLEVTPLIVGDTLYACNAAGEIFALDAENGHGRWRASIGDGHARTCRGVAYFAAPRAVGPCARRIIAAGGAALLVALDAETGRRCAGFGDGGEVNLLAGLSAAPKGYYQVTSAPAIVRGRIVLGGWVSDGQYVGEPSGVIRAFDAITGKMAWAWDMGRPDRSGLPPPGETYTRGTPNSWAPISSDEALGLVFLPTGNATPDYFGGHRRAIDDRYSSSVVALDIVTGKPRWSFQTTHHDLWDYDVPAQPIVIDLPGTGGAIQKAIVQVTKRGEIFVMDRLTGQPLRRVEERPVPQAGAVPEERLARTQPFSVEMPSFRGADLREADMWGLTPLDQLYCRILYRESRYEGTMTPPGLEPWLNSPGTIGGMDWSGAAIDVRRGVMIVNSNAFIYRNRLVRRLEAERRGFKPLGENGGGSDVEGGVPQIGTPYGAIIGPFLSPLGVPCQAPPYGRLSAVDLVSGKLIWSRPLGAASGSGPLGYHSHIPFTLGTLMVGGPTVTASGLVFIAGTQDSRLRAIDVSSGRELWHAMLPRNAFAVPTVYRGARTGRQYVVVAAGGLKALGGNDRAELVAYALGGHDSHPPRRAQ